MTPFRHRFVQRFSFLSPFLCHHLPRCPIFHSSSSFSASSNPSLPFLVLFFLFPPFITSLSSFLRCLSTSAAPPVSSRTKPGDRNCNTRCDYSNPAQCVCVACVVLWTANVAGTPTEATFSTLTDVYTSGDRSCL